MRAASLRGFDRLAINDRPAGSGLTSRLDTQSLPKRPHQALPDTCIAPLAKVVVDCRPGRVIMGQQPPRAATAQDIKDPIENLTHIHASGAASWLGWRDQGLQDGPFGIREVTGIRFHRGSISFTSHL